MPTLLNTNMALQINKIPEIRLSALRMHSASLVQIHNNITDFTSLQPYVQLNPLKLHAASSFHAPSSSINDYFHNGPKVVLSPYMYTVRLNGWG